MQEDGERPRQDGETRPQRGGEAATTRFGMEDGDSTETPATGGPPPEQEEDEEEAPE